MNYKVHLFRSSITNKNSNNIKCLANTTPSGNANYEYDAFNRLTRAVYPERIYDYVYDPFGNMLTAQENGVTVFSKTYTAANRIEGHSYDGRGNLTDGGGFSQLWDKRNRLVESRVTAGGALLGSFTYNERGLRVKAERNAITSVQVVVPNGGESYYSGSMVPISWNGTGLGSGLVKLELLVDGVVAGTIAENIPGSQTTYQWQAGKMLNGWAAPGTDLKVRVTAVLPSASSGATYYFYDSGGRLLSEYNSSGSCVKDYLYLGGKMIGEYVPSSSSYYYYGSDQINSTRLVTDSTGAVVHSAQYDPYGGLYKTWVDTYHPKPGFSGKEREFGSELDYFGARYYNHISYRFNSVDPLISKEDTISDLQKWNLYSYCSNNPITRSDPDGRVDGNNWQDQMPNGGGWKQVNGKEFRQVMKGPLIVAGGILAAGATIAAGPAAGEAALAFMAKHPGVIQNLISGALNPGPAEDNLASFGGWCLSNAKDLNTLYIPGVKQTTTDVREKLNRAYSNFAYKVTNTINNLVQLFTPKSFGPNYNGQ